MNESSSTYDGFADWYAAHAGAGNWVQEAILANLNQLTGDVADLAVLDLACGEGFYSRALRQRGAVPTGVDLSEPLLRFARNRDANHTADYVHDDAQRLASFSDASFDSAICMMALMDIPDLAAVFRSVHRVVRPGGWFVGAITHPCFETPHAGWLEMDGSMVRTAVRYLREGNWISRNGEGVRARAGAEHRTLSTYLNTAIAAGWTLDRLVEPANNKPDDPTPDIPRLMMMRFTRA
jgi:ubiquinone/menaquinone biosynthesis C-methylase UbiE